jgi:hypothetical protein
MSNIPAPWSWYGDELLSPFAFVMEARVRPGPADKILIAAAPELYAALDDIADTLACGIPDDEIRREMLAIARAALI